MKNKYSVRSAIRTHLHLTLQLKIHEQNLNFMFIWILTIIYKDIKLMFYSLMLS